MRFSDISSYTSYFATVAGRRGGRVDLPPGLADALPTPGQRARKPRHHWKTMGTPQEHHRKTIGKWWFSMGINGV